MNVYRIYTFFVWFIFALLLMNWQKGGERFWELIYACLSYYLRIHVLFMQKEEKYLYKKGRSIWRVYLCLFPHLCIYMLLVLCTLMNILIVYCYAWVKGELLWSLTLIHAYITSWVLSSSKRQRLLAQRPISLVLMMINSCSYRY